MITFEMTDSSWATLEADDASAREVCRDIVAMGGSTGGLSAMCKLLGSLPEAFDSAILIALDMGSQPAASVLQVLSGYCRLAIGYATDGALVRRNCVLIAPLGHHMSVTPPGIIRLEEGHTFSRASPCVNRLFGSCALTYGQRVIGVLLSGGSHDGAIGLKRISAAGGIGMVQHPEEAADASMPAHAMRIARPAYCNGIDEMVPLLIALRSGSMPSAAPAHVNRKNGAAAVSASDHDLVALNTSSTLRRSKPREWLHQVFG
jgi:two-component system chemotaxis response regulator CheB